MRFADQTLASFTDALASSAPTPGGGPAAALEGALGAALVSMVCALTVGKANYAGVQDLAGDAGQQARALMAEFLDAMDRDARAFGAVAAVFAMPKETDGEKSARRAAMQEALKGCVEPPLQMMELSCRALELTRSVTGRLNAGAASDLGCAALGLKAAVQSAWLNVLVNLNSIRDESFAGRYRRDGQAILARALPLADEIYQTVLASL